MSLLSEQPEFQNLSPNQEEIFNKYKNLLKNENELKHFATKTLYDLYNNQLKHIEPTDFGKQNVRYITMLKNNDLRSYDYFNHTNTPFIEQKIKGWLEMIRELIMFDSTFMDNLIDGCYNPTEESKLININTNQKSLNAKQILKKYKELEKDDLKYVYFNRSVDNVNIKLIPLQNKTFYLQNKKFFHNIRNDLPRYDFKRPSIKKWYEMIKFLISKDSTFMNNLIDGRYNPTGLLDSQINYINYVKDLKNDS